MSSYRIVLNLTGNAGRKIDKIADDLVRADVAASSLARSLGRVSVASRSIGTIRSNYVGGSRGGGVGGRINPVTGQPHYTRHRSTRIASFGTGFNIGGFSGRLSTILQPDAMGNIMGMNASSLMKGANIAALATSIVGSVAKTAAKVIAGATIAPIIFGGGILMGAINALQSESFAGGVRLISRRHQARLGLGAEYERAQTGADFLAGAYGFDRSTTLSSINVLSGMGVGGSSRKLTTGEATGLTKVGGLIAQQSGVSFERVMTNIQQLLVQTTPHIRDIREMLNQAPILGKYALKDMEAKGVTGVDARTWLKDQGNIMSALKRYELDMATNQGMQARGQIALAQQDFWAKIASNDKFWKLIGSSGSSVIGSAGNAIDTLMSTLAASDSFRVMVAHIETIFDKFGTEGGSFIQKLSDLIDKIAQRYGFDIGDKSAARAKVGREKTVEALMADSTFRSSVLNYAEAKGVFKDYDTKEARSQKEALILNQAEEALKKNPAFFKSIVAENKADRNESLVDYLTKAGVTANPLSYIYRKTGTADNNRVAAFNSIGAPDSDSTFRYLTPSVKAAIEGGITSPIDEYMSYAANTNDAMKAIKDMIDEQQAVGSFDPKDFNKGEAMGKDLTGTNADRRALEIHFNAPIVEWNNTMETMTPQETVDAVSGNIEQLTAAAIQKALLGASNKMSSRWY